jgi:hypothetical protein
MKKLLLTAAGTLLTVAAFAQGTVTFQNASSISGWNPIVDRNVKFGATAALYNPLLQAGANVSSNYAGVDLTFLRVALYYAPGAVTDVGLFSQAAGGAATFKASTSATAGSWFGGTRTLSTGVAPQGGLASLFVVVWDSRLGSDPLAGAAQAGLWGSSAIFQYTTPTSPTPAPPDFLPNALTSFSIGIIPEPSSFALAGLGAAALLIFRRRK